MKKIRIFLASSSDLMEDRVHLETFIGRQNKSYIDAGIFLELIIWEDFIDAMSKTRLQDEYNRAIKDSDIFVMLFFTKVGKYSLEEFETAYINFKRNNRPLIYTYFKNATVMSGDLTRENVNSLFDFRDKVRDLEHYVTYYNNTDHLTLHFGEQLRKFDTTGDNPQQTNKESIVILDDLYEKLRPCRATMELILSNWADARQKNHEKINARSVSGLSSEEKEDFIDYYNKEYHSKPPNSEKRKLSDEIHYYLHELHDLKSKIENGQIEKFGVLEKFGHGLNLDGELIGLYLKAHWAEHNQDRRPIKNRFWNKVLDLIQDSNEWVNDN